MFICAATAALLAVTLQGWTLQVGGPVVLASAAAPSGSSGRLNVPVEYYKLPNGLKVVLSRDATLQGAN